MAIQGVGTTVTFSSGYFAKIVNMSIGPLEREAYDTTNFSTTGGKTYGFSSVYEPGEVQIEFIFDPEIDFVALMSAAAETATITFSDSAPASTLAGSAAVTRLEIGLPLEEAVTGTATLKFSGDLTHG